MKYGIIGAGPSGLIMAKFLNAPCLVLEQQTTPGGHTGSFSENGYTFDFGPHIMFSKNKKILDFMIHTLGKNIHQCRRNNKIYYKKRFIKYPFENDLHSLPAEDTHACLMTYVYNRYKTLYKRPKNLKQWFLKNFGKGICERYLFPYNEKIWKIPVQDLSMLWADRIPNPPPEDIVKSAIGIETEGYLHQLFYHYPLRGGYQALCDAWARDVPVQYGFQVKNITKTKDGTFRLSDGNQSYSFDRIISTMPIHELIRVIDFPIPAAVIRAVRKLRVNSMYVVCLGIKGNDKNAYTAVYFPEDDFLVHRIGFPKTFSPYNAPDGHYSIQAEITCRKHSSLWKYNDRQILGLVKKGLIERGIISKQSCVYEKVIRSDYAYVVYDTNYEKNVHLVRQWFPTHGIHLVGRFSYFEYVNVDGAIERALKTVASLTGKNPADGIQLL